MWSHLQFILHEVKTTFTFMRRSFISRPYSTENTGTVYARRLPDHTRQKSVSHLLKPLHLIKHRPDHQMVQIYTKPSKLVGTVTNTKVEALQICIWWSYRKCSSYTVIFCFSLSHCYLHCHGPMRGVYEFWQFLFNYVLNHYTNDEVSMYFWHTSAWIK